MARLGLASEDAVVIVMKFGGTSVGSRERLERMAQLVNAETRPTVVVVSAMADSTDRLLEAGLLAEAGDWAGAQAVVDQLRSLALGATSDPEAHVATEALISELTSILHGVHLLREQTERTRALVVSFGERLSIHQAAAWLRSLGRRAEPVDAREIVRTDDAYGEAVVDIDVTTALTRERLLPRLGQGITPVVTGFLGSTATGITTTLGRGGSDYTAALLGNLLDAEEIVIWTDVDGILTADPRFVSEARSLRQVSYREAAEMSYFGAKVLHPKTMVPALQKHIPIRIRSTFEPHLPGTVVADTSEPIAEGVKTVTSISDLALVTVDGRGLAGIPGMARRIFEATEAAGANVVMISQASSEQTVTFVVPEDHASPLVRVLRERFQLELHQGLVERIESRPDVAVVSVIGEGMAGTPGVSGKLFGSLGTLDVNVLAIAQGASEMSISVAVDGRQMRKAVRAIHTAFGLTRIVHLAVLGAGTVGQAFLQMLEDVVDALHAQDLDLRLVALGNSRRLLLDAEGLAPRDAVAALTDAPERPDDATLMQRLVEQRFTDVIVVDLTAAPTVGLHEEALRAGFHLVTANKVPISGPLEDYRRLVAARDAAGVRYGYETTFGAGLPVLHTLKELVATGDTLKTVRGCFSGTLGFLCTQLDAGVPLGEAVASAQAQGYTEPDPREDLSGRDVARKALIIARAMGRQLEPADVELEPLVPGLDDGLDVAVERFQEELASRIAAEAEAGRVLRYVAEIDDAGVRVGLRAVDARSAIGSLSGPDNILVFQTRRYDTYPLVVRGPGAGADVTAAGVLGDVIKIARG